MLVGSISTQTFLPGKRISGRAIKTVAEICADPSKKVKRYCNGSPDATCDATGFVVSLVKFKKPEQYFNWKSFSVLHRKRKGNRGL